MKKKYMIRIASICMAAALAFTPANAYAASLKKGSSGTEVRMVQATLKKLGYFSYPRTTGYFGSVTVSAVKKFQKDNGIRPDGVVGKLTKNALLSKEDNTKKAEVSVMSLASETTPKVAEENKGALDWYTKVQYIFARGDVAEVMDIETGRSFYMKRTFGTNHADVEPLTSEDAGIIKDIWGGWTWTRRAVVVKIDGYVLAGSLSAMPHAGVDSKPAVSYISNRSGGYGWGQNLDSVKNNGVSGVMDLHFKNSRTHNTNTVKQAHQIMVNKAAEYIAENY